MFHPDRVSHLHTYTYFLESEVEISLRLLDIVSIAPLVSLLTDPELYTHIEDRFSADRAAVTQRVTAWTQRNLRFIERQMWINWVAYLRESAGKTSELIGHVQATIEAKILDRDNFSQVDARYNCQLGWMLATPYHNRGIGTRLVKEVIAQVKTLFSEINFLAYIHYDNQASQRIAQKIGMQPVSQEGQDQLWVLVEKE